MIQLAASPVPAFLMTRPLDQAVLLDRDGWALKSPAGDRPPRRLRRHLFMVMDIVTRHPGVVVEYDVLIDALWPGTYQPIDPKMSIWVYANTLRDLLVEQGWPREVLVTRQGIGLQIDKQLAQQTIDAANGV